MSIYQLPKVEFNFKLPDSPLNWSVCRFHIDERLGHPYAILIDLVADGMSNTNDLLGSCCTLEIIREKRKRQFNGVILEYLDMGHSIALHHAARIQMGPPLALLAHGLNSKVFQDLAAPEVIEKVIKDGIRQFFPKVNLRLRTTYAKRECCIQYRESDWDFIQRLMAEEGLTLFFEPNGSSETVVLTDMNQARTLVDTIDGKPIPVMDMTSEAGWRECISNFFGTRRIGASSSIVSVNDWTRGPITSSQKGKAPINREVYDCALQAIFSGYQGKTYTKSHESDRSKVELERAFALQNVASGKSDVVTLGVGKYFEVGEQLVPMADKSFVVISAKHNGISPEALETNSDGEIIEGQEPYCNQFDCIPSDIPFRPVRGEKRAIIPGVLTATVVGSSSEEIHTDAHGRIRIQFHWDRDGKNDHMSTCWVRVAQSWAGSGFGTLFIPRIGMEVLVQFVNGDPDHPIVVGCVYNGKNSPPVQLPDKKSQSTIRTESSKGGGGFNELRFEDMTGREEIYVHAQKDMNEEVLNDHSQLVKHDQAILVENNQTQVVKVDQSEEIGNNQTLAVKGNRDKFVKLDESNSINGHRTTSISKTDTKTVVLAETIDVGAVRSLTVGGAESISVGASRSISVGGGQSVSVGGSLTTSVGKGESRTIDKSRTTDIKENETLNVKKKMEVHVDQEIIMQQGKTILGFKKDGVSLNAGAEIKIFHDSGVIQIAKNGSISISSSKPVEVKVRSSSAKLESSKITIKGSKTNIN